MRQMAACLACGGQGCGRIPCGFRKWLRARAETVACRQLYCFGVSTEWLSDPTGAQRIGIDAPARTA